MQDWNIQKWWKIITIGEVSDIISWFAFKSKDFIDYWVPVIKISNIRHWYIDIWNNTQFVSNTFSEINPKYHLSKGDILISLTGSNINQWNSVVWRVGLYRINEKSFLNQRAWKFLVDITKIDSTYLYYVLFSDRLRYGIALLWQGGANQANISPSDVKWLEILIPESLSLQKKIAAILSNYDELIENNNRRIQILEQTAQEIYKEWFVDYRFPWHESIKMIESGTDFWKIPEGWEIVKMNTLWKVITWKTPSTKDSSNFGNYLPFIKTPDLHWNIFCIKTEQCLSEKWVSSQMNKILPVNSLIVSCIWTVWVVSITSELSQTNQQINTLVLGDLIYLEYLYFKFKWLKQHLMNIWSNGATMTNVNKDKFENIEILVPSNDLMGNFNLIVNPLFQEILVMQNENENLKKTRDLLLPKLISWEIDVSELEII